MTSSLLALPRELTPHRGDTSLRVLERADADWLFRLAQENDRYLARGGIQGS